MEGKVDLVGVLDAFEHRLRLPPCLVFIVVEIREVLRRVRLGPSGITDLTRFLGARRTRLHAELRGTFFTTCVSGLHKDIEGRVLESRDASLRTQHTHMTGGSQHRVPLPKYLKLIIYSTLLPRLRMRGVLLPQPHTS